MIVIKDMITSGLVNQQRARFEKGFPQVRDNFARSVRFEDPFVQTNVYSKLAKSEFVKPENLEINPSQVFYNDIFGKSTTADVRNYLAHQLLQAKKAPRAKNHKLRRNIPKPDLQIMDTSGESNSVLYQNVITDSDKGSINVNGATTVVPFNQQQPVEVKKHETRYNGQPKLSIDTMIHTRDLMPREVVMTNAVDEFSDQFYTPTSPGIEDRLTEMNDLSVPTHSLGPSPTTTFLESLPVVPTHGVPSNAKNIIIRKGKVTKRVKPQDSKLKKKLEMLSKKDQSRSVLTETGVVKAEIANGLAPPVNERRRTSDAAVETSLGKRKGSEIQGGGKRFKEASEEHLGKRRRESVGGGGGKRFKEAGEEHLGKRRRDSVGEGGGKRFKEASEEHLGKRRRDSVGGGGGKRTRINRRALGGITIDTNVQRRVGPVISKKRMTQSMNERIPIPRNLPRT